MKSEKAFKKLPPFTLRGMPNVHSIHILEYLAKHKRLEVEESKEELDSIADSLSRSIKKGKAEDLLVLMEEIEAQITSHSIKGQELMLIELKHEYYQKVIKGIDISGFETSTLLSNKEYETKNRGKRIITRSKNR